MMTTSIERFATVFPGQGCQYLGMCREYIESDARIASIFNTASDILGYDLRDMIENGTMKLLTQSMNAQPAVVTASYALFSALFDLGGRDTMVLIGHSLGELSALAVAGGISFEDAVMFARRRGEIMGEAVHQRYGRAGVVVDIDQNRLEDAVFRVCQDEYVAITGFNSPRQFVVAGTKRGLHQLDDEISAGGGNLIPFRMMPMKADAPYHCALMNPLKPLIAAELEKLTLYDPHMPVFSTVTATPLTTAADIRKALTDQLISPVLWTQALEKAQATYHLDCFIDIGPSQISSNLIAENIFLNNCLPWDGDGKNVILTSIGSGSFALNQS